MSIRGFNWKFDSITENDFFSQICKNRDLNPSVKNLWPCWKEMNEAIDFILANLDKKFAIVGDYDVDGTIGTSIMVDFFTKVGIEFEYFIPNRFEEGYGLSFEIINKFSNIHCVITIDNGSSSIDEINYLFSKGIKTIVLDHHTINEIPKCFFLNCQTINLTLCASGVVFIFLIELNKAMKKKIDMRYYTDWVAIATICDMVPLNGLNRILVSQGVHKLNHSPHPIFAKLQSISQSKNVGFSIGPFLNSAGRMHSGNIVVEMLCGKYELLETLMQLNYRRKVEERKIINSCYKQIEDMDVTKQFLLLKKEDWHEGVIGVVCSKIKEQFNKNVLIFTFNGRIWKGSIRSHNSFHCGKFASLAVKEKVAIKGGGHAMAGGLTILDINKFSLWTKDYFEKYIFPVPELNINSIISLFAVNKKTYELIQKLEPFGKENESPLFLIPNCIIKDFYDWGEHTTISLTNGLNNVKTNLFFTAYHPLRSLREKGLKFHVLCKIVSNNEIELVDAMPAKNKSY